MSAYKLFFWLVLCVLIGAGLYFFQPFAPAHETDLLVPVMPENMPEGLTIASNRLKPIEFRVKGGQSVLDSLLDQKIHYALDLSGVTIGTITIPIKKENLSLPGGVSVINITPSSMTVRVEKEITKEVPVSIVFTGNPAAGFRVANASAKPARVTLKGPETLLTPMTKVTAQSIELNRVSESFKKEVTLDLAEGLALTASQNLILVEIVMDAEIVVKKIPGIPIGGRGAAHAFTIEPPQVSIEIKGPAITLDRTDIQKEIRASVDLEGLAPGIHERQVAVTVPADITVVEIEPESFKVTVFVKP